MKRYLLIGLMILFYLSLIGCASRNPYINYDLTREKWMQEVDISPNSWARGSDSWFLTGDPSWAEEANRNAPYSAAISTMMVSVPDFTNIKVEGDFQVQIFGTYDQNSVYVYGPNLAVREISIDVRGNTLCITQAKKAPTSVRRVVIRIGINQLNSLVRTGGCGSIEGIRLRSNGLFIASGPRSTGNMYLAGNVNLHRITNAGAGVISVFGANSSWVEINTLGKGSVNVSGHVGLKSIVHRGANDINIIGAIPTIGTKIYADGVGKIGINGRLNLTDIQAKDKTRVFAYPVASNYIYVYTYNYARVGLAGYTKDLYVDTGDMSHFEGRYLCAQNAYVRARNYSHINVSANNKIFASATQNGSVYFFGSPDLLSQFVSTNGVVMPIWTNSAMNCGINFVHVPDERIEVDKRVGYARERGREAYRSVRHVPVHHKTAEVPYQSRYTSSITKKNQKQVQSQAQTKSKSKSKLKTQSKAQIQNEIQTQINTEMKTKSKSQTQE